MIERNSTKQDYEVSVGFMDAGVVRGSCPAEAIKSARRKLSSQMPGMWDVIYGLADARFDVTCVSKN